MANIITGDTPLEVEFSDFSTIADHPITQWNWDFGDGSTSSLQNPEHTYQEAGVYTVSLSITDSENNSETEIKSDYLTITTSEEPTADFSSDVASGTNPLEVSFTDQSVQGITTITQWSWNFGDGTTSTVQNPEHTYQNAGAYTVSLTVTDANSNSDTEIKENFISVYELPGTPSNPEPADEATAVAISTALSWTNGSNTDLVDLYLGTQNTPTEKVLSDAIVETYQPAELSHQIIYYWKIVNKNAHGNTEGDIWSFTTDGNTGISDFTSTEKFSIYPNPAKKQIYIKIPEVVDLSISNISGKIVLIKENFKGGIIDISTLDKGIYVIVLKIKDGIISRKLIIN